MHTRATKPIRLSLALLVITALLVGAPVMASPQTAPQAAPVNRIAVAPVTAPLGAAVTFDLCADPGTLTMADSTPVPIWGFSDCNDSLAITTVPGPTLTVTQGDVVTVNLSNQLGEAVSLAFHGQGLPADTVGAPSTGSTSYTFTASTPGTFLYEAGLTANGAKQVAMGLHGALVVLPTTPPTTYTSEKVLVLSEIDPALNNAPASFNMQNYAPKYWLINGESYPATDVILAPAGQTLLARYVNAGLDEHSMGLLGLDQLVIAKDGHARPAFRAVSETLAAGQTMDTLITPLGAAGTRYPLYDTNKHLDNNGAPSGGMMTFIEVVAPPSDTVGPTTSGGNASPNPTDGAITVTLTATADDTATGNSNIMAAEWFEGPDPGVGLGNSMGPVDAFDSPTEGLTTNIDVSLWTLGDHTVSIRSQDAAGNWGGTTTVVISVTVAPPDTVGPTTSGGNASPSPTDGAITVTLTATADDTATGNSNIMAAEWFEGPDPGVGLGNSMGPVDAFDSPTEGLTTNIDVSLWTLGDHTVSIRSQDAATNWGATMDVVISVTVAPPSDTVGPTTSGLSATPGSTTGLVSVALSATIDDATTGNSNIAAAEYFIGAAPGADGTGTAMTVGTATPTEAATATIPTSALILLTPGTITIHIHGRDLAGNWGPTVSTTFTYAPPLNKHVGDLDSTAANPPGPTTWTATLTIKIENSSHVAVSGVAVGILWTPLLPLGSSGTGGLTCTTAAVTGICTVTRSLIPDGTLSVTATVTGAVLVPAAGPYTAAYNHDPDAEPNLNVLITAMTIARP